MWKGKKISRIATLLIILTTMGNFWDNCYPRYLQKGLGVGWIVNL